MYIGAKLLTLHSHTEGLRDMGIWSLVLLFFQHAQPDSAKRSARSKGSSTDNEREAVFRELDPYVFLACSSQPGSSKVRQIRNGPRKRTITTLISLCKDWFRQGETHHLQAKLLELGSSERGQGRTPFEGR